MKPWLKNLVTVYQRTQHTNVNTPIGEMRETWEMLGEAINDARSINDNVLDALKDLVGMCNMPEVKQAMMKHNQAYYHGTMHAANYAIYKAEQ